MQKQLKSVLAAVTIIFVLVTVSAANAQQDIIDKLEVKSIKSIQVRQGANNIFLDIKVNLTNGNEKEIRLKSGVFTFEMGSKYIRDVGRKELAYEGPLSESECAAFVKGNSDIADKETKIGKAEKPFFIPSYEYKEKEDENKEEKLVRRFDCENVDDIYLKPDGGENLIMFHVNIGGSKMTAFDNLMHIMNCIGYPQIKSSYINIEGKFDMGVRSAKGWSEVEAVKIQWLFIPQIQDKVNFMTAVPAP